MCQSPGECERVKDATFLAHALQIELDAEREKTTAQFFRISELTEENQSLRAALDKAAIQISGVLVMISEAQKGVA